MIEDSELLRRYATDHSEAAFTEVIQRHVNLVYSAALRLVSGDTHRAQDVTQQVFTELARRSKHLTRHPALAGWLYTTTRLMALRSTRTEFRRKAREREANLMNEILSQPAAQPDWEHLRPVLEGAMHELGEKDRLAVLLRYFQNKNLADVGAALGLNENAARMRVERALDKLRAQLARKGVTSSAGALALTLAGNAVTAAPSTFVATLTSTSLAGAASGGGAIALLKFIAQTKLNLGTGAVVIASAATTLVIQYQSQARMRETGDSLQQRASQLAESRAENERLANLTVRSGDTSFNNANDLLKLRAEVGSLQNQSQVLSALEEENRRLRARNWRASDNAKTRLEQKEGQLAESFARLNYGRGWMLAFHKYAEDHDNQFPTNFVQAMSYLPDEAKSETNLTTDQFEIVYQGSRNTLTKSEDVIVIREKQARQFSDGKWARAYAFADGHSEIHAEPNGDFDSFERQRIISPPNQ